MNMKKNALSLFPSCKSQKIWFLKTDDIENKAKPRKNHIMILNQFKKVVFMTQYIKACPINFSLQSSKIGIQKCYKNWDAGWLGHAQYIKSPYLTL